LSDGEGVSTLLREREEKILMNAMKGVISNLLLNVTAVGREAEG